MKERAFFFFKYLYPMLVATSKVTMFTHLYLTVVEYLNSVNEVDEVN